jgi:hypothetical protein
MTEDYKQLLEAWEERKRDLMFLTPEAAWKWLQKDCLFFGMWGHRSHEVFWTANRCGLVEYLVNGEWVQH